MRSPREMQRLGNWLGSHPKSVRAVTRRRLKYATYSRAYRGTRLLTEAEIDLFCAAVDQARAPVKPVRFTMPDHIIIPPTVKTMAFEVRGLKPIIVPSSGARPEWAS